ncbi:DUF5064 family protein [Pseudomonas sp. PDM14]|uniref:DUF5064 family protein n=1 Tax=Pseudomonas sp. PDM14 TaxID=2769288 RepID=UPI0017806182|nr:DUF5064 family protein [Pseudomonas sp. PDM14]MBD9481813.1 DUF5064 family protein [Pseudomonas sp. PDM14]
MFTPGHLHRSSSPGQPDFTIDFHYDVRQDAKEGPMLHCRLQGSIEGKAFEETFELHRDTAFNFASVATRIAAKHGLPTQHGLIMRGHDAYDRMFEDIREKLGVQSGDTVDLDHLEQDGL